MTYTIKEVDGKFRVMDGPICSSEHTTEGDAYESLGLLQRMDALYQDLEPMMEKVTELQNKISELEKQWLALGRKK